MLGSQWIRKKVRSGKLRGQIALMAPTSSDVRDTVVLNGIIPLSDPESEAPNYEPSKSRVVWNSGVIAKMYCCTEDTEALTPDGWKHVDDIKVGDTIRTLDVSTGLACWEPVKAMNVYAVEDQEIVNTEMNMHSSRVTFDHKWPVINKVTKKLDWRDSILDFTTHDGIITSAKSSDTPSEKIHSDAYVALVGWFTSEGSVSLFNELCTQDTCDDPDGYFNLVNERKKYLGWTYEQIGERCDWSADQVRQAINKNPPTDKSVRDVVAYALGLATSSLDKFFEPKFRRVVGSITQNRDRYYDEIKYWLEQLFGEQSKTLKDITEPAWKEKPGNARYGNFILNHEATMYLMNACHNNSDKVVKLSFINELTLEQLEIFSDAYVKADGSVRGTAAVITQKVAERLDSLEYANILLGKTVKRGKRYHSLSVDFSPKMVPEAYKDANRILVDSPELMFTESIRAGGCYPVGYISGRGRDNRQIEYYTGRVWCPTTNNGTWLARSNGTVYYTGNSAEKGQERIRGSNNEIAWIDELGSIENKDVFDQMMFTLRVGESRCLITTTPRPTPAIIHLYKNAVFNDDPPKKGKNCRIITGSTYDNFRNLSEAFKSTIISAYEGTRLGSQELEGKLLLNSEGALWSTETLSNQTLDADVDPPVESVAIGVDPAVSSGKRSDLTGIVVAGVSPDLTGYILGDFSGKYSTQGWVNKVISLYDSYRERGCTASVVVERNMGGKMISEALQRERAFLPIDEVFHSNNKLSRASPISLLYEQGKIFHVRGLNDLETEMVTFEGRPGQKSPDRLDAMVMALTYLLPTVKSHTSTFDFII